MKNWWLYLFSGFFFAGNVFAATYDATGNWDYTELNHWNNCAEPNPGTEQGTDTIIQKGDNFTLIGKRGTVTGTVSGATYTAVTMFFEDGGETTLTFRVTASSSTQADGDVTWTWSGFGETCEGGWTTSYTKQPQSPPLYDATGTWDYSDFNHSNTCNEPNELPVSEVITLTQNGNKVTVVDATRRVYDGFIDGAIYTFVGSYPEDGGTTSEIFTVPLKAGGTSGDGTGYWVWNDASGICDGRFNFTITKQGPATTGPATTTLSAGDLDGNGRDDVVVDFGSLGFWAWMNDASWLKLHPTLSPDRVAIGDMDGNGQDDVIADFSSTAGGIYVKRNLGSWLKLHGAASQSLTTGDLDGSGRDDLVVDFGSLGFWARMNDASWSKLHPTLSPDRVAIGDMDGNGQDDVIADFSSTAGGIYVKRNLGTWLKLHGAASQSLTTGDLDGSGRDDLVVDFGSLGFWARMNDASWLKLHPTLSPDVVDTGDVDGNGADDVLATFGSSVGGFWQKLNLGSWSKLNNSAPDDVETGDVDGSAPDDIIADFSSTVGGVWVKRNQTPWVKLHNASPQAL